MLLIHNLTVDVINSTTARITHEIVYNYAVGGADDKLLINEALELRIGIIGVHIKLSRDLL